MDRFCLGTYFLRNPLLWMSHRLTDWSETSSAHLRTHRLEGLALRSSFMLRKHVIFAGHHEIDPRCLVEIGCDVLKADVDPHAETVQRVVILH